jgi:hypothetical protein
MVKGVISHSLKEDWETDWLKTNPYDKEGEYLDWVDEQYDRVYTKYAIYVETSKPYGKQYACKELGWDNEADKGWGLSNELDPKYNDELLELWDTEEEAEKAMQEYKQVFPDKNPKVVPVYSEDDNDIFVEDIQDIFTWERWEEEKHGY